MRLFMCADCKHTWQVTFMMNDHKNIKFACPQCKSLSVLHTEMVKSWNWQLGIKLNLPIKQSSKKELDNEYTSRKTTK